MGKVFILQNSDQHYLDRHGDWVDGREASSLYRTPHKDEAINQQVELTVRHPELRIRLIDCQLDDKGRPQVAVDDNGPDTAHQPPAEQLEF